MLQTTFSNSWWRHQMETFSALLVDCFTSHAGEHRCAEPVGVWNRLRYSPFVRGIHRSPVNSPLKAQWTRNFDDWSPLFLSSLTKYIINYDMITIKTTWCFLWCAPEQRLSKQSRRRWFESLSRSLWRHCNGTGRCRLVPHGWVMTAIIKCGLALLIHF